MSLRTFVLRRDADVSGVSGTGDVAAGVVFADGTTVLRWNRAGGSTAVYDSLERMEAIHGHDGRTSVVWLADRLSVEPAGMDGAWREAEAALIAAQGDDDGFGVEIAYWSEFPDAPWSVVANDVQVEAPRLPDALRKLAALLPTQASDSPEKP